MLLYHGTYRLFDSFDLNGALEGNGKVKFGYGIYLTGSFNSAAHYSYHDGAEHFYVYEVEIPELTSDNSIDFRSPIPYSVQKRTEVLLGGKIPEKYLANGKLFRKYLASKLGGSQDLLSELRAASFLNSIGVIAITWPYSWRNPNLGNNVAVFDAGHITIKQIFEVTLDSRLRLLDAVKL